MEQLRLMRIFQQGLGYVRGSGKGSLGENWFQSPGFQNKDILAKGMGPECAYTAPWFLWVTADGEDAAPGAAPAPARSCPSEVAFCWATWTCSALEVLSIRDSC